MNKTQIKSTLKNLFTIVKKETSEEVYAFKLEDMQEFINHTATLNPNYPIYQAVSKAMHDSGLSFNFSYEIAKRAVDVILDTDEEKLEDSEHDFSEKIDQQVPIYYAELMQIYLSDWETVDEVANTFGNITDCVSGARQAWYNEIEKMLSAIITNLKL